MLAACPSLKSLEPLQNGKKGRRSGRIDVGRNYSTDSNLHKVSFPSNTPNPATHHTSASISLSLSRPNPLSIPIRKLLNRWQEPQHSVVTLSSAFYCKLHKLQDNPLFVFWWRPVPMVNEFSLDSPSSLSLYLFPSSITSPKKTFQHAHTSMIFIRIWTC